MIVCPQFADLKSVADAVKIPVFAQHVDPISPGSHTGHILPESMKESGCSGTLINHSEHKLQLEVIEKCVRRAKEINLKTICCAADVDEAREIAKLSPDYIAYEPPELIGSGIPVSKTKPEVVEQFVRAIKDVDPKIIPLCGAGISMGEDVAAALRLGCAGVLLASGVVKAENPEKALAGLLDY
jgi:triosephosphate isomerase